MKKNIFYIIVLTVLAMFSSCSEEEVPTFDSPTGVNFLASDGYGGFTDNYLNLSTEINLYQAYFKSMEVGAEETTIAFQIEGTIPEKDMKVRLASEALEGYEKATIDSPADSVIKAGEYRQTITLTCHKPDEMEKEYAANIVFDYANSDVVAGTKERQKFKVIVKDATDWQSMNVSDEKEWNELYSSILGNYGPMKVRFILYALGKNGATLEEIEEMYYYTPTYPFYGFSDDIVELLKEELNAYNAEQGNPLTEPDGTTVSF